MRKFLVLSILLSVITLSFASTGITNDIHTLTVKAPITTENSCQTDESSEQRKDCTVRFDFETENGTTIQGELTFSDVTWWECTKMQIAAWWERNF